MLFLQRSRVFARLQALSALSAGPAYRMAGEPHGSEYGRESFHEPPLRSRRVNRMLERAPCGGSSFDLATLLRRCFVYCWFAWVEDIPRTLALYFLRGGSGQSRTSVCFATTRIPLAGSQRTKRGRTNWKLRPILEGLRFRQ